MGDVTWRVDACERFDGSWRASVFYTTPSRRGAKDYGRLEREACGDYPGREFRRLRGLGVKMIMADDVDPADLTPGHLEAYRSSLREAQAAKRARLDAYARAIGRVAES